MADESIGGFFVKLGLKTDKKAFSDGATALNGIEGNVKKLSGLLKGAIFTGFIAQNAKAEAQELKTARAIGITTSALDKWKISAGKAGVNASSLVGSMQSLENKMQGLKLGQVDTGLANSLGMLGIGYGEFADMDAEQRIKSVFEKAGKLDDQAKAAKIVGDVLGSSAQDYYHFLALSGKTLEEELADSERLNFTSEESKKKAMEFNYAMQGVLAATKSIASLVGSELAGNLTPALNSLKDFLGNNKETVARGISQGLGIVEKVIKGIYEAGKKAKPYLQFFIDRMGGLDKAIVKIGIGLAGLKLAQFTGGVASAMSGLLGLKGVLLSAGLAAGFALIQNLDSESLEKIKSSFESLKETIQSESFKESMKIFTDWCKNLAGNLLTGTIEQINELAKAFDALMKKDWEKFKEHTWEFGNWLGATIASAVTGEDVNAVKERTSSGQAVITALSKERSDKLTFLQMLGGKKLKYSELSDETKALLKKAIEKGNSPDLYKDWVDFSEINDGIVSPNGRVTRVSPNDWVVAMKDLSNLSGGIAASRNGNYNSNTTVAVNQTFNIQGGNRGDYREVARQAEKGTRAALTELTNQSAQRIMLMSGVV